MGRRRLVVGVVVAFSAATVLTATSALAADAKPTASEIGVTPTEIRIAVIADVDTPLAPGAYAGARDAVQGFAKYMNQQGGLAGRKVVVDFYDSKLSGDETRGTRSSRRARTTSRSSAPGRCSSTTSMTWSGAPTRRAPRPASRRPRRDDLGGAAEPAGVVPDHRAGEGVQRSQRPHVPGTGRAASAGTCRTCPRTCTGSSSSAPTSPRSTTTMPIWLGKAPEGRHRERRRVRRARRRPAGQVPADGDHDAVQGLDHRVRVASTTRRRPTCSRRRRCRASAP